MKYEYGVEYETNGKKPDLPDDVYIHCTGISGLYWNPKPVCNWDFKRRDYGRIVSFKVVDERYKPVDDDYQPVIISCAGGQGGSGGIGYLADGVIGYKDDSDWYDYDKQQAIALPPVGVECGYISQFFGTKKHYSGNCKVIAYYQNKVWIDVVRYNEFVISLDVIKFRPLDWNRKADEEKRKFVEVAGSMIKTAKVCGNDECGIARYLYEQGCRFTENKAAS